MKYLECKVLVQTPAGAVLFNDFCESYERTETGIKLRGVFGLQGADQTIVVDNPRSLIVTCTESEQAKARREVAQRATEVQKIRGDRGTNGYPPRRADAGTSPAQPERGRPSMTATQKYQALVEAVAKEKGCDRSTAAAIVAKEYPAVRRAMLEEANPGRDVGAVMGSRRD